MDISFSKNDSTEGKYSFFYSKLEIIFLILVSFTTFSVFFKTIAPTVTFWDAGEFITCSYILGIPHPPGTPFFVLLGRLWTLLPLGGEIAFRVNLLSALASSLASGFLFHVIFRLLRKLNSSDSKPLNLFSCYFGGIAGALALSFSESFWSNSTESEVYGASMFLMIFTTWLALVWADNFRKKANDRIYMLIYYLCFLGIGIHLQNLLLVLVFFLAFVIFQDNSKLRDIRLWVIFFISFILIPSTVNYFILFEEMLLVTLVALFLLERHRLRVIYLFASITIFTASLFWSDIYLEENNDNIIYFILLLAAFVIALFTVYGKYGQKARPKEIVSQDKKKWIFALALLVMIFIGYSIHIYIPVRSRLDPAVDENDPETWEQVHQFLERKQYGQEAMMVSMFTRKAKWENLFGVYENIGLWGFFRTQFSGKEWAGIPFILGLFGIGALFASEKRKALFIFTILFAATIGMALYLNFSDGTKGVKLEVRERDYFYTPGFMFWALFMGIGLGKISEILSNFSRKIAATAGQYGCYGVLFLFCSSALYYGPYKKNYWTHDRSNNYIAYDYAENILTSCEKNGLIFTNGDNDTFPLWFIQEVENFRKDIRVINLSLLNTPWYIKQLRDWEPKVPINLSDEEIDDMPPGIKLKDKILRRQDIMVHQIIKDTSNTHPIYFAITVPEENKCNLEPYLRLEGFVYRLVPEKGDRQIEPVKMYHNFFDKYKFRGLNDPSVYKDSNTINLLNNYIAIFTELSLYHKKNNEIDKAIEIFERGIEKCPPRHQQFYNYLLQLYLDTNNLEKADRLAENMKKYTFLDEIYYVTKSYVYNAKGDNKNAINLLEKGNVLYPKNKEIYSSLIRLYIGEKEVTKAMNLLDTWLRYNPDDKDAQRLAKSLNSGLSNAAKGKQNIEVRKQQNNQDTGESSASNTQNEEEN